MRRPPSLRRRAGIATLLSVASVGPVLYPAWLALRTRRLADPVPPELDIWPAVTVVIPAFREASIIAEKIENTLAAEYPGELSIIVVAEDPETFAAASATRARVIGEGMRRGKAGALNLGIGAATTPVVVLTDANAMIEPGAIASLVRWLSDPTVGAVAGEKRMLNGEGFYWAFESWLKRREWRLGTTIGVGGELAALRRDAYVELPTDVAVDDLWIALDMVESGQRIAYEPRATASEQAGASLAADWERRTRIVAGALDALWRRRRMLVPGRSPVAVQLIGHRLVRSSPGPLAHAALVVLSLGSLGRSRLARAFLTANAFGAWSLWRERHERSAPRAGQLLGQAMFLHAVGVGGTLRYLRRERLAKWPKPERMAPSGSSKSGMAEADEPGHDSGSAATASRD